jgi:hypothetical protein
VNAGSSALIAVRTFWFWHLAFASHFRVKLGFAAQEVQSLAVMHNENGVAFHSTGRFCESGHFRCLKARPPTFKLDDVDVDLIWGLALSLPRPDKKSAASFS